MNGTKETLKAAGISRRNLLKGASALAGVAAGAGALGGFPTVWAQTNITLRQFGTGVSNLNAIAEKCKADLGITLEMTATDSDAAAQRAVTQPDSYDIADIEYWILKKVFPAGVIQPMDVSKLNYYDKIVPLFKNGKLTPESTIAQGTAPHTVGYVDSLESKEFAKAETGFFTMVPTIYNADTLGIRPDLVGREITTWADIMDPAFKGKTSILNIPSIGIMDAAMIMEAMGNITYADKGNMTKAEIDATIDFLIKAKAAHLSGAQLDAAYEYINWYTSGWVGGYLNRQGYYSAAMDTAKEYMSEDEWGFWIEGKPAVGDILNPDGVVMEKAGAVRDGGSFLERMGSVACWNSVMDEDRYMVTRWNEFIAA